MEHQWYKSGDGHLCNDWGECQTCTLSVCKVCGLFEGSLTTDCPGERVSYDMGEEIYTRKLDYREGEGWVNKFSPHQQSSLYSNIFKFLRGDSKYKSEAEIMISYGASKSEFNEIKKQLLKDLMEK